MINPKFLKLNNLKIEYVELGEGKPLFFIHGASGSFRFYEQLLLELSKHFKVYAPSMPGIGRSENFPKNWKFEDYKHLLHEFINTKEIKERIVICGHSMGGAIAADFAINYSEKVEKLILVNSAGIPFKNYYLANFRGFLVEEIMFLKNSNLKQKVKLIPWDGRNMFLRRPFQMMKLNKVLQSIDLKEKFSKITVPTLVLWGEKDKVLPLKDANEIHSLIPSSKLKIIKGGVHSWLAYIPEKCAQQILDF